MTRSICSSSWSGTVWRAPAGCTFSTPGDKYFLSVSGNESLQYKGLRLAIESSSPLKRTVHLAHDRDNVPALDADAGSMRVARPPDLNGQNMNVTLELSNLVQHEQDEDIQRAGFPQSFSVPMPGPLRELNHATPQDYADASPNAPGTRSE